MELSGKVCLVTGATGGIGRATALEFARRGADVVVHCRSLSSAAARTVQSDIEALGRRSALAAADFASSAAGAKCVEEAVTQMGRLDVMVHCAGGPVPGSLMELCAEDWYRAFEVHVHAVFHLCRAAVPHMVRAGGGSVVLVSSAAGLRGCAGAIGYGVAKGTLPQFARALARELADHNIRVNCVSPGIIRTPFQDFLTPEQVRNNVQNRIPLHREGTPAQVAEVIAMLASNEFITGENVAIDGGMTMRIA
jgi:NAD(P)-dependent dehydrogenase (short-subunit alcohol dehydrogenase family)